MDIDLTNRAKEIVRDKFNVVDITLEKAQEGSVSHVLFFDIRDKKYVIKFLKTKILANELLFYKKAEECNVAVPSVYANDNVDEEYSYYITDFIIGHNDPDTDTKDFFTQTVDSIKKLHTVSFQGFGRNIGSVTEPAFEKTIWHSWLEREVNRLHEELQSYNKKELLEALDVVASCYTHILPDVPSASLVHGDLGFGNILYSKGKVYFIDPGWNRAMPPLWEVAYFDYKYINDPTRDYRSKLFRKNYFPNGPTDDQEREMAIYRLLSAIETYRWYLKKGLDESVIKDKYERNLILFNRLVR